MRGDVEVQQTTLGRWRIILQGTYATQADAEAQARYLAKALGVELFIRGILGRLLRRDSHGNDPKDVVG